jgi:hypothetical protein
MSRGIVSAISCLDADHSADLGQAHTQAISNSNRLPLAHTLLANEHVQRLVGSPRELDEITGDQCQDIAGRQSATGQLDNDRDVQGKQVLRRG